ncbi:bifunctional salicylyl-CoA 5-hydroxylase/oxidoreductase [Capillimicrobium parvum]|uniref:NADPH dehydrogenase n=1 Tax=Capillimicrobium parvum TaxID=2884022 RepID=A0A9E6XU81_9ACTN|nr:bifunctional salicylyl-CoA 5-hydroxylase/oxidoreductase [Capillimicrobium parvum]UGS33877.1 NADPH dehydrogenase [Capillimicrobium parvum]
MKIAITGGGPGGLYAAILFSRLGAGHEVTVWERNAPDDTFGFGVVFSDETLTAFEAADPPTFAQITESFARWSDIDIHYRGTVQRSGGHGFSALSRQQLLHILQSRAIELGVEVHFQAEAPPIEQLTAGYDLVIASDGINSVVRETLADRFEPSLDRRRCKFMWLGTDLVFEAFTFHIVETEWGVFQIHGYPYDATMSTFIVETDEQTWRRAGLDATEHHQFAPGENDEEAIAFCREAFADILQGHSLVANNSRWLNFQTVRNEHWSAGNVVLLGDAAHTAHFSIGSGTKLAMEDAIALAWAFRDHDGDVPDALAAYEAERRPVVASTQRAAQASLEWFEGISRYVGQDPCTFAFNLLTRSRRITYDNLRVRDADFVQRVDEVFCGAGTGGAASNGRGQTRPPMFMPLRLRDLELANRVIVSPMDMYSAVDGTVGDFHLAHLGTRAEGGAAMVMTEMICVSAEGRITPGCGGLYRDDHIAGWKRVVDFVHAYTPARIGAQIGHSGRKGSTKLMWEGIDEPLPEGGWDVIAPSPLPYFPHSPVPREMTRADMDAVTADFVATTERAADCGFDLLEVHFAHGYLLSSFLSPLTNQRTDEYGGTLKARAKFPLEVLDACRAVWPAQKPMSVRISATDWTPGGFDGDDAVELARMLREHDVDIVDVSSGQVWADDAPAYGRSFQTPFADRIRHEVGIPTIAVGAISSWDDVNTTILAGRADLCALGRPHLYDPFWTLHAASEQGYYHREHWIPQYQGGSWRPMDGRLDATKPPPRSFDTAAEARGSGRWKPAAA